MKDLMKVCINEPLTIYAKEILESYEWFNRLKEKSVANEGLSLEIWSEMFPMSEPEPEQLLSEKHLQKLEQKHAVILLGLSCTGKTTYATKFLKRHPQYEFCSMDEVETKIMFLLLKKFENNIPMHPLQIMKLLDAYGIQEFGKMLEDNAKKNVNILVDGEFVTPNARGALIRTLRRLGYRIVIFDFTTISGNLWRDMIKARTLLSLEFSDRSAECSLEEKKAIREQLYTNCLTIKAELSKKWEETQEFKAEYEKDLKETENEVDQSLLLLQKLHNLLYQGADMVYTLY